MGIAANLATAVRHQLDDLGWTQHLLARTVGVSDKHMSFILSGRGEASIALWDRIFDTLADAQRYCTCVTCRPTWAGMRVCRECGDKRCPGAKDHRRHESGEAAALAELIVRITEGRA